MFHFAGSEDQILNLVMEAHTSNENKGRFDYICMFRVLEHMDYLNHHFAALNHLSN